MTTPYPRPPAGYPQAPRPQAPAYAPTPPVSTPQAYGQSSSDSSDAEGGSRVEAALRDLADVKDAPPAEQVGPLTQAHRVLRETLESIGDV